MDNSTLFQTLRDVYHKAEADSFETARKIVDHYVEQLVKLFESDCNTNPDCMLPHKYFCYPFSIKGIDFDECTCKLFGVEHSDNQPIPTIDQNTVSVIYIIKVIINELTCRGFDVHVEMDEEKTTVYPWFFIGESS